MEPGLPLLLTNAWKHFLASRGGLVRERAPPEDSKENDLSLVSLVFGPTGLPSFASRARPSCLARLARLARLASQTPLCVVASFVASPLAQLLASLA